MGADSVEFSGAHRVTVGSVGNGTQDDSRFSPMSRGCNMKVS